MTLQIIYIFIYNIDRLLFLVIPQILKTLSLSNFSQAIPISPLSPVLFYRKITYHIKILVCVVMVIQSRNSLNEKQVLNRLPRIGAFTRKFPHQNIIYWYDCKKVNFFIAKNSIINCFQFWTFCSNYITESSQKLLHKFSVFVFCSMLLKAHKQITRKLYCQYLFLVTSYRKFLKK